MSAANFNQGAPNQNNRPNLGWEADLQSESSKPQNLWQYCWVSFVINFFIYMPVCSPSRVSFCACGLYNSTDKADEYIPMKYAPDFDLLYFAVVILSAPND